jgi:hypothetical protein
MDAGRFVGRVGGLAVALGAGAVIALCSSAIASADDTGNSGTSASASSRSHSASAAGHTGRKSAPAASSQAADAHKATAAAVGRTGPAAGRLRIAKTATPTTPTSTTGLDLLALATAASTNSVTTVKTITLTDGTAVAATVSSDGSRAVVTSVDSSGTFTNFTVVNTVTGVKVGTTVKIAGYSYGYSDVTINSIGSRAVVVTHDPNTTTARLRIAVIDLGTGTQVGATSSITGFASPIAATSIDSTGTRALLYGLGTTSTDFNPVSKLAIIDLTTGARNTTKSYTGQIYAGFSGDGSRAVVSVITSSADMDLSKSTSQVMVFRSTNGAQVGPTLSRTGTAIAALNPTGTKVLISAVTGDGTTLKYSSSVTVVTTSTGAATGTPVTLTGLTLKPLFNADGSRAYYSPYDFIAGNSGIATIDTTTGKQLGLTVKTAGFNTAIYAALFGQDVPPLTLVAGGTRVALNTTAATFIPGAPTGTQNRVLLVDAVTGAKVGATFSLTTSKPAFMGSVFQVSADGKRILFGAPDQTGTGATTQLVTRYMVIDATTGTQIGTTKVLASDLAAPEVYLTPDGKKIVTVSTSFAKNTTTVKVMDATTGTQIGTTFTLTGHAWTGNTDQRSVKLSGDGTRAMVTTADTTGNSYAQFINTTTGTAIGKTTVGTLFSASLSRDGSTADVMTMSGAGLKVTTLKITVA